jgi:hypothetical protein
VKRRMRGKKEGYKEELSEIRNERKKNEEKCNEEWMN